MLRILLLEKEERMIKPPQQLIDEFMEWYKNDDHSSNEDYYKNVISVDQLSSMEKSEFIDFFTDFAASGGRIQSGGHRTKNLFRKTITEKFKSFKPYVLSVFLPEFKVYDWLERTKDYNYFGTGLATIFLNRVNKKIFSVVNDKTKDSLELFGIKLPTKIEKRYEAVQQAQLQLIEWFPEIDNFYRADALNHFLVGIEEGKKLAKQLLTPNYLGRRYWICGLGEGAKFWDECRSQNIAVFGFDKLPALSEFNSKKEIAEAIKKATGQEKNPTNDVLAAWQIVNEIKRGDILIAKRGAKTFLGYGIVSGPYRYDKTRTSYRNIIPVIWEKTGEWQEEDGKKIVLKTLTDITPYPDYVKRLISMMGIDTVHGNVSEADPISNYQVSGPAIASQNLILYGPPGTGKTYRLTQFFDEYTSSSTGESEASYLARLVADKPWWQIVGAAVLDSGKVKVPTLLKHPLIQAKLAQANIQLPNHRLWGTLQRRTVQDCPHVNYQKKLDPQIFWKDADSTWSIKVDLLMDLAPEIIELKDQSKQRPETESVKRYEFVTFHQSYGYEEFVEGIRPVMDDNVEGEVQYRIEPGVFKKICQRAENDPEHQYAIFIDEINRGNISKIFGELITLVEPDKRLLNGKGMRIRLPYSQQEFGVPSNLSIIGTMNTADRSIAFIDIALRRRFQFKEMMPELDVIEKAVGIVEGVNVKDLLFKINRRIEFLYDRDHVIGHSYFLKCRTLTDLKTVLQENIIPLLQEYFYGDWEKICLVLGCGTNGNGVAQSNAAPVIKAEKLDEKEILGFDHLDYEDSWRYEVNPDFVGASGEGLQKFFVGIVSSKKSIGTQSSE